MCTQPSKNNGVETEVDSMEHVVNLCGKTCPETFVEAKIALEDLEDGDRLCVIVDDTSSAERVPRNMENHGQLHVRTVKENGVWRLVFERKEDSDRNRWVLLD